MSFVVSVPRSVETVRGDRRYETLFSLRLSTLGLYFNYVRVWVPVR